MAYQAAIEALGATCRPQPSASLLRPCAREWWTAENPIVIYDLKLYESQKYITIVNYLYSSMTHVVSKKVFDSLTDDQRKIIIEESDKSRLLMRELVRKQEQDQIADMKSKGIRIGLRTSLPSVRRWAPPMRRSGRI